jgi:hypothetical protein
VPGIVEPGAGAGAEDPGPAAGSESGETKKPDTATALEERAELAPTPASASANQGLHISRARRSRLAFRHWRRTRAFWGGFLLILSGSEILYTYNAPFKVVLHFGLYGIAGYALPALVIVLGALVLFDPEHRVFYSVIGLFAAAGTWLTSNLGGFFIGMLLGLAGATLTYGWSDAPIAPKKQKTARPDAEAANGDQGPQTAAS